MLRCNKCGQAEPHLSDSWCLGCAALEALNGELRLGWGAAGSRALAHDVLSTAVRQVRALRRLGIAGAGKGRALTPERGASQVCAPPPAPRAPAPPPAETEREPKDTRGEGESAPAASESVRAVKEEQAAEESGSEYTEDDEETEEEEFCESGLKPAPKASAESQDRPEIPRRRTVERPEGRDRDDRRTREPSRHRERRGEREEERHRDRRSEYPHHGRGRSRTPRGDRPKRKDKKRKRKRPHHRGGSRHQKVWKAAEDPYRRFHYQQPGSFWDRPPDAL